MSTSDMERLHLLSTVVAYPGLSTQDVCERANEECQHDAFDPLPYVEQRAIAPKLEALKHAGLIDNWQDFDGPRWEPTNAGVKASMEYLNALDVPASSEGGAS